jgi:hypothetical protein
MPPSSKRRAHSIAWGETSQENRRQKRIGHPTADVPGAGGQHALQEPGQQPDDGVQHPQHPNAPSNNRAVLTLNSWPHSWAALLCTCACHCNTAHPLQRTNCQTADRLQTPLPLNISKVFFFIFGSLVYIPTLVD